MSDNNGESNIIVHYENDEVREKAKFQKAIDGDAGFDLFNATNETITLPPYQSVQVDAGIKIKIPRGYCGLLRARSSTFFKKKLFVVGGLIDSGYTGKIYTFVWNPNLGEINRPVLIKPWESLSQLIIVPCPILGVVEGEMPSTERGENGFGSTHD